MSSSPEPQLQYVTFPVGSLTTNCIIVFDEKKRACVIDAGGDASRIIQELKERQLNPEWILATHNHFDHILAIAEVKSVFPDAQTAINEEDRFLWEALDQQCQLFGLPLEPQQIPGPPDFEITGSPQLKWKDGTVFGKVIHTPGHSPGSQCFYFESLAMVSTGDTLFQQSIGRTDLWGSDFAQLKQSVQERLYTLPGETWCIPGHGGKTKIHLEAEWNPFVRSPEHENKGGGGSSLMDFDEVRQALAGTTTSIKPHRCRGCDALAQWKEAPPRI